MTDTEKTPVELSRYDELLLKAQNGPLSEKEWKEWRSYVKSDVRLRTTSEALGFDLFSGLSKRSGRSTGTTKK